MTTATRREIPTYAGSIDVTVIENGDDFPAVYVDHERPWIEIGDHRVAGDRAEFVAWLRDVADLIERCDA